MKEQKTLYKFEIQDGSRLRKFALLYPTRRVRQDGELYYTAQLSRFVSAGVLPRALWEKTIKNNGGSVAEPDRRQYQSLYTQLVEANKTLEDIVVVAEENRTEEQKAALTKAQADLVSIRAEMQKIEAEQMALYENTAEAKARNQSITWWSLHLIGEADNNGVYTPIIQGETVEDKLDACDEIAENDPFLSNVLKRSNYLITVWYIGAANTVEDFGKFDKDFLLREGEITGKDLAQESAKQEEAKDVDDLAP